MNAYEIHKKINELRFAISDGQEESASREISQTLMLLIRENESLNLSEKEKLFNELRETVRPLARIDYQNGNSVFEINTLLGELCLAASFYLLADEKHLRLFEAEEDTFVRLNKRSFENCFFSIISAMFRTNDEISVEIRSSGKYCSVIISSKNFDARLLKNPPDNSLIIYEVLGNAIALKLKPNSKKEYEYEYEYEDFSLLLADSFSPLQVWLCDI